jgi:hypothetical protein
VALPKTGRWADTEDARRIIANVRASLARWKAAGHDVEELEQYLSSPDPTPTGIDSRLRLLLRTEGGPWPGDLEHPAPFLCPYCANKINPSWQNCPYCRSDLSAAKHPTRGTRVARWAETVEGRRVLKAVKETIRGWKAEGHDVGEIESYLESPDITSAGVDRVLGAWAKWVAIQDRGGSGRPDPPERPKRPAGRPPKDRNRPSRGVRSARPGPAPNPERCPDCRSRLGPKDRKCPVCGRRLGPWKVF